MSRSKKKRDSNATYCRSYLVTLGLVFSALGIFTLQSVATDLDSAHWWHFALLASFLFGGVGLVLLGLLGPEEKMEGWAEVSSRHEASLIIMALAYPVYLAISPFFSKR